MNRLAAVFLLFPVIAWATLGARAQEPDEPGRGRPKLETLQSKASYALGYQIGLDFKYRGTDYDLDLLVRGIKDALAGVKPPLAREEMDDARRRFDVESMERRMAEGKKAGEAFLAENAKRKGVVVLESGLQYEVLRPGDGLAPEITDRVKVHYRGTLIDGTEFDSSHGRGEPAVFPLNRVIRGWTEALQLMKVGAKWRLFVPSELAYGTRPPPGSGIGPNEVLVFEVELLSIEGE
jgi:FKBP-type peptidyl-prolyl cis-trans isomerase FklB